MVAKRSGESPPPDLPDLTPKAPLSLTRPAQNAAVPASKPVAFSWRWGGESKPASYRVAVTGVEPQRGTLISKLTRVPTYTHSSGLDPGKYRWQVYAVVDSTTISSDPGTFTVSDEFDFLSVILFGLLLAVVVGGLRHFNRRRIRGHELP